MASRTFLITMIVAAAVAPAFAMEYMVGDNAGWKRDVNYTAWAAGKDFRVGDSLMFMYTSGEHNVIKVNATEFQQCTVLNATDKNFTTGNDKIPLAGPGKKWYISGIADDCSKGGMKLVITVSAAEGPAPQPTPGSAAPSPGTSAAAGEVSALKSCVWMVAVMTAYTMIMA